MERLLLRPNSEDYNQEEGSEVIAVQLDGGAGRYRRDKVGASRKVNVSWTMNPNQYQYWRAFWNTATKRGTLPFLCDLVSEDGTGPIQHVCYFVPGSVSMPAQQGLTYKQSAVLEVKPNPVDDELNTAVMALFATSTDSDVLWDLGRLVNETAPEALL
jgi:hypothetical protein